MICPKKMYKHTIYEQITPINIVCCKHTLFLYLNKETVILFTLKYFDYKETFCFLFNTTYQ